jgi:hypothetical protein
MNYEHIKPGMYLKHLGFGLVIKVIQKSSIHEDAFFCEVVEKGMTLKTLGCKAHYKKHLLEDDRLIQVEYSS